VLSVFGAHCSNTIFQHRTDIEWHFGQLGVLIFFVHTCLVLMASMERLGDAGMIRRFYLRRAARIYPLAIFCVTLSFILCRVGLSPDGFTWRELAGNVTLSHNLFYQRDMVAALWSLPLEVQMYVLLPFVFCCCGTDPAGGRSACGRQASP
jgi:peptidoglycan/LPS O-acetylase OafA/YrhL